MTVEQTNSSGHSINGISLVSFLQVLEQENKTCTVSIECGEEKGKLFFYEGRLIDAESGSMEGLEAAYDILSWNTPTFVMEGFEERPDLISQSLTHVILEATTLKDEQRAPEVKKPQREAKPSMNTVLAKIAKRLAAISGVQHHLILNRQGEVVVQSMKNAKIGDFIAYCVVNGMQMREALSAKGLHNIRIRLEDDTMLLIVPANSITIALLLSSDATMSEVYTGLRNALSRK